MPALSMSPFVHKLNFRQFALSACMVTRVSSGMDKLECSSTSSRSFFSNVSLMYVIIHYYYYY